MCVLVIVRARVSFYSSTRACLLRAHGYVRNNISAKRKQKNKKEDERDEEEKENRQDEEEEKEVEEEKEERQEEVPFQLD